MEKTVKGLIIMTGQQIITCKKCGSNKMDVKTARAHSFALLMTTGVLTIFIITIPAAFVFFFLWILSLFSSNGSAKCMECKKSQVVSKEKLKEYKQFQVNR